MTNIKNNVTVKISNNSNTRLIIIAIVVFAVLIGLFSCTPLSNAELDSQEKSSLTVPSEVSVDTNTDPDNIPRISKEELLQNLENGENILIVDTRYKSEYDQDHIKGAVSAPYSDIVLKKWQPPPDQEVVLYCG